jgi:FAD/FMN-containing dehydrogenase/Fe-S oxidoreductase
LSSPFPILQPKPLQPKPLQPKPLQPQLPPPQRPHPHEEFHQARELESRLRAAVRGEVRFDAGSRAVYATDSSNYRQPPIGVVVPRDAADVESAFAVCRELDAPVLARGGGTSLAGQCCNVAVVFDFSKYMRHLHSIDFNAKLAEVEPGIVLDRVRERAETHQLTFAPDPATHSRCTIGGMIGNNSCGVHALMGGKTVDNIRALDVLLYDGTRMTVGATSEDELAQIIAARGRRGAIYAGLKAIRDKYAPLIRERYPKIPRRVSGYNLDSLLPEHGLHVARALVGSEGTCVTVLGATLELMPSPPCRRLVVAAFKDGYTAADWVPEILKHEPIGLEGFDHLLIDFMRRKHLAEDDIALLPRGGGFLLVEFGGWSAEEAEDKARRFADAAVGYDAHPEVKLCSEDEAKRIWRVRESALGATVFVPGEPHGWEGWEDSAVAPAKLGSYLRQLFALMGEYGYRSPLYGHFGQGCVHLRINFDLEHAEGIARYREFIDRAADIVVAHGGSFSGEHGDGQSRGALLPKMFGPELIGAFREFKALWDPLNRMNPGKMTDPVEVYQPTDNLRLGAGYLSHREDTFFRFPEDKGSLSEATLRCVGVGACRKEDTGTMCPSYMATHEEQHSTRGRAHLLWEMLEGDILDHEWQSEAVKEALDLCLSCKACKTECPVSVDMATYKAEFLAHYYQDHRRRLRDYGFAFMDRWARLASVIPGITPHLANLPLATPGLNTLVKAALGVAPRRSLPRFAPRSYQSGRRSRQKAEGEFPAAGLREGGKTVLLWPDTWNNYYHPQTLRSAEAVLTAAGFRVQVPRGHICCGRPLYDFGFLTEAQQYLERILERFGPEIDSGMPIVVLEPSCASVFRDELRNFFPGSERAARLAQQTWLLGDFLERNAPGFHPPDLSGREILLHGHCHQKSLMSMTSDAALLRKTGAQVRVLDSGCCGMAGPFGFEKEKFAVSQILAERGLLPAVRAASQQTIVVTDGFSCREQIAQNLPRRATHLADVLAGRMAQATASTK